MTEITSVPSISSGWSSTATAPTSGDQSLGKDAFLKLLVAQLKYQDPSNPTDSTQFMAQTAQFTLVEKFEQVSALTESLLTNSRSQTAVSLVGQKVTFTDDSGKTNTGVVGGVSMEAGEPVLTIGDLKIRLDAVTQVGAGGADSSTDTKDPADTSTPSTSA
jgi:flagellar basal-body rod modification protein FlgD